MPIEPIKPIASSATVLDFWELEFMSQEQDLEFDGVMRVLGESHMSMTL